MRVWLVLLLAVASNAFAERELSWRALDVNARLDAEGRLHVKERHSIVFTGDWNGGERKFNVRGGQELKLTGMSRIDPATDVAFPMREGKLDEVDQFAWIDSETLRWRSRRSGEAEFDGTLLVYDIAYTIVPVVAKTTRGLFLDEPRYRLDHDFAFPDRPAAIERFTLRLDLDPGWQGDNVFKNVIAGPLRSGQSYVAHLPLEFRGAVAPGALPWLQSRVGFDLLWLLLLGGTLLSVLLFLLRELAAGQFDRASSSRVDESWLQENILTHPPEVVGALWDEEVGSAEIAAILARMSAEKKIKTQQLGGKGGLSFTLKVPASSLPATDRAVVDALFQTRQTTNTAEIASTGKGAAAIAAAEPLIREDIQAAFPQLETRWRFPAVGNFLTTAGVVLFCLALFWNRDQMIFIVLPGLATMVLSQIAMHGAGRWKSSVSPTVLHALHLGGPLAMAFLFALSVVRGRPPLDAGQTIGWVGSTVEILSGLLSAAAAFVLIAVGMIASALGAAGATGGRERLRVRRDLAAARRYFIDQLGLQSPSLHDDWYPYLLAFGLAPAVEQWFRSFGDAPEDERNRSRSSSSGGTAHSAPSTPSSPAQWTGGGGGFGGAGATASWAAATSALSSSGASSSSGGSSSSSSGGGSSSSSSSSSSSGGGGGGGW